QESHWGGDDARARLKLPENFARLGMHGLKPAVQGPIEDHIPRRCQHAAPGWLRLLDAPYLFARCRIPGDQFTQMAATAWKHEDIGPNIGCPCRVLGLYPFIVHTHVVGRHVEQASARRKGGGLLVLAAHRTWTDFLRVGPLLRALRRILDGASRLLVDPLGP